MLPISWSQEFKNSVVLPIPLLQALGVACLADHQLTVNGLELELPTLPMAALMILATLMAWAVTLLLSKQIPRI